MSLDAGGSRDPDDEREFSWNFDWICTARDADGGGNPGPCLRRRGSSAAAGGTTPLGTLPNAAKLEGLMLYGGASGGGGLTYTFGLTVRRGGRSAKVQTTVRRRCAS